MKTLIATVRLEGEVSRLTILKRKRVNDKTRTVSNKLQRANLFNN